MISQINCNLLSNDSHIYFIYVYLNKKTFKSFFLKKMMYIKTYKLFEYVKFKLKIYV